MKSVALHNLGCKVNAYEMDVMQQMLQEKGYKIVSFDEQADIYIVNTCTVTNIADRKSRQMLHQAKKRNPDAVVVAVGCYVQTGKEKVLLDEGIDLCIGNNKKKELILILETFLNERENISLNEDLKEKDLVSEGGSKANTLKGSLKGDKTLHDTSIIDINHTLEYEELKLTKTAEHTRAYIKIQDGCNQFCSYCIIPYARGRVRSRKAEDILSEIQGLVKNGYKEIVLTGIHISSYGIDFGEENEQTEGIKYTGKSRLLGLVREIHKIEGLERIRLGSLEPRIISEEFVREISRMEKICPHFHLSLQSGSNATLKRMNRHYTAEEYYEKVKLLREAYDHPAITTDVITGFPGETAEEFEETRKYLEKISFYEMHIFKYSKRQKTAAAAMKEQVPDEIKQERSAVLLELQREQSKRFRERKIGAFAEVLFEEKKEIGGRSYQVGHTAEYIKVAKEGEENWSNRLASGKIVGFLTEEILLME
ncbi:MAG: tRNA (N(6)-L-threonylcarbamoyladenosine(37)-C(2))-methylthiotransferase MtaB [Lachnospiraceae bacterium]|nr:tRNA (N(6)-L-threonylcarbamoyladenosine(37)-C(2))-methylthiotransferase MtaB [Lachnospiraceae bacterium]